MKGERLQEVIEAKKARDGEQAAEDLLNFGTAFCVVINYMKSANAGRTLTTGDALALREASRCIAQLAKSLGIKLAESHAVVKAICADVEDMIKDLGGN